MMDVHYEALYKDWCKQKEIVERLEKEANWFYSYHKIDSEWSSTSVKNLLQKILEGEK